MPRPCSRRRALQLLGAAPAAGLAGCLGGPLASVGTPTAEPSPVDVSFTATVEQSFTDDHPGRITVTLANEAGVPLAMGVAHGIEGPLSVVEGEREGGDATLILLGDPPSDDRATPPGAPCESGEYAIPETPTDGCWRPACDFARLTAQYAIPLEAGETLSWPYVVLDGFNDACHPPGTYRFEESPPIAVGAEAGGATPPGGPSHYLTKRVTVELAADGTLSADATVTVEPIDGTQDPTGTDPATPRRADG